jgi:hypothetical protein
LIDRLFYARRCASRPFELYVLQELIGFRRPKLADPPEDLDLRLVVHVFWRTQKHLIEAARHYVEGNAPEFAGQVLAVRGRAEFTDRRRRFFDPVIERHEEVRDGLRSLHTPERRRR